MGTQDEKAAGPDLSVSGIRVAELPDGAMMLGHASGEPVLLVRQQGELFAVGAVCTHYGGPLPEGLLVGETVRCPWHHACFSLRTGEALRAPALNPLPRWRVERRDERIYVREKLEHDPLAPVADRTDADARTRRALASVVIIGAGAAGSAAAEMLRREGYGGRVVMIDREEESPYDRPNLSKEYLAGEAQEEWIPLRPPGFYEEHGIELVRGQVTAIDTGAHRVQLADGSSHEYGALLLATGAEPIRLDVPGGDLPHVRVLRSLADSRALIALAEGAQRAVVIGASFIGLEAAASLRARGLEVHVVAPETKPLVRVMGEELGAMIRALHEEHGVNFHMQRKAERIEADAVVLDGGDRLPADFVAVGIGVRPRLELAERAGLAMERGIVVDKYLETSTPGIFAAGDMARWPDPHTGERIRVEHWVVAQRQGQTAARNILGHREAFDAVPFFWSKHYDLTIRYVGHAERFDRADVSGSVAERACSVAFRDGGRTLAVASIKRDRENLGAEVALEQDDEKALQRLVAAR